MSQREKNQGPPRRDDEAIDRDEDSAEAETGQLSFDDLPFANPTGSGQAPFVRELQKRAETSVHKPAAAAADGDVETIERWSPRVQVLCIMGGSALCWAVILAPFLLF